MFCPYCGTKNENDALRCVNCLNALPQKQAAPAPAKQGAPAPTQSSEQPGQPVPPTQPAVPQRVIQPQAALANPLTAPVTTGGLSGMIGGGLATLGWFLPWVSLGIFGSGGNGPQLVLSLVTAGLLGGGLAGLTGEDAAGLLIACLTLALIAVVLIVPVAGILAVRDGWQLFSKRSDPAGQMALAEAIDNADGIRKRLLLIVVLMGLSFVVASFVSVGALGIGFWVTALGALGGFVGVLYALSQLGMISGNRSAGE